MTTLAQTETQLLDRIEEVGDKIKRVRETTASVIFGQERVIDLALITVLSGGHALLIGVPGLAKTLWSRPSAPCSGSRTSASSSRPT